MTGRPVPPEGWHIAIERSSAADWTPDVTEATWQPGVNARPRVQATVAYSQQREDLVDTLLSGPSGAVARAWLDSQQLPIDTLANAEIRRDRGEIRLVLTGGRQLDRRVKHQTNIEEATNTASQVVGNNTAYARDIDTISATRSNVQFFNGSGIELEDLFSPTATDPFTFTQLNGLELQQMAYFSEAESGTTTGNAASIIDPQSRYSDNEAIELPTEQDELDLSFNTDYDIPDMHIGFLFAVVDGSSGNTPGFGVEFNGSVLLDVTENTLVASNDKYDLRWFDVGVSGTVTAGQQDLTAFIPSNQGGGGTLDRIIIDAVAVYDDRHYSIGTWDDNPTDLSGQGVVSDPESAKPVSIESKVLRSVQDINSATVNLTINNFGQGQAVSLSNDGGSNYNQQSNTDSHTASFGTTGLKLRLRVTLDAYGSQSSSPTDSPNQQHVDAIDLTAETDDAPVLVDTLIDDSVEGALDTVTSAGELVWELARDSSEPASNVDGLEFRLTQAGERTGVGTYQPVNVEGERRTEEAVERVVVRGGSSDRTDRLAIKQHGQLGGLEGSPIVPGSEVVTDTGTSERLERGVDYQMDYSEGAIKTLADGSVTLSAVLEVDYRVQSRAEWPRNPPSNPSTRVVRLSSVYSDVEARQAAREVYRVAGEPRFETTLTVDDVDPTRSLLDAISEALPWDEEAVVYDVRRQPGVVELDAGSRQTVSEVVSQIESRITDLSERS